MARDKIHEDAAARQRAYRARHDLVTLTVEVPRQVIEGFEEYLKFKNKTKNQVITNLLQQQLLRKR